MPPNVTNFPLNPRRGTGDWWSVWFNLQWLASQIASGAIGGGGTGYPPTTGQLGKVLTVTTDGAAPTWAAGTPGPPGTPGPGGTYIFTQGTPSTTWTIAHNLNAYPSVTVVDTGGSEIIPTVVYTDANHLTLTFGAATTGKAYLN